MRSEGTAAAEGGGRPAESAPADAVSAGRPIAAPGRGAARIVAWNIRAGGGCRAEALARQLRRWRADLVALCEFRATPPSLALARALAERGLAHQLTTAVPDAPRDNSLLVASRWPLSRIHEPHAPNEPGRCWLLASVAAPRAFAVGAMHVPNRVTGCKWPFLDAALAVAERWRGGPALLLGDTNSGRPGIDEQSPAFNQREGDWIESLERAGWLDAFRHLRGRARQYTWYSPNGGHGFRIDQAFVNRPLLGCLTAARHDWGRRGPARGRGAGLSDHAALVLDLDLGRTAPDVVPGARSGTKSAWSDQAVVARGRVRVDPGDSTSTGRRRDQGEA